MDIKKFIQCCRKSDFDHIKNVTWGTGDVRITIMDSTAFAVSIDYPEKRFVVVPMDVIEPGKFEETILDNVQFLADAGLTYDITARSSQGVTEVFPCVRCISSWKAVYCVDYTVLDIKESA